MRFIQFEQARERWQIHKARKRKDKLISFLCLTVQFLLDLKVEIREKPCGPCLKVTCI